MPEVSAHEARAPLVVAVDLGTSSVRAMLHDGAGRGVEGAVSQIPYKMTVTPDGGVEKDADSLVEIIFQSVDELLAHTESIFQVGNPACPSRPDVAAVAVSTFLHSLVGVGQEGRAITPLYSWNDTRAAAAADHLRGRLDERAVHARTGCALHASYWPAKLAWLAEAAPEVFGRARWWLSIGEYLCLRLFGRALSSTSMASATGLFNQNENDWDRELLRLLTITPDHLSRVVDGAAGFGRLGSAASRWPALSGAEWFAPLGDGPCSNVGSGSINSDRAALMIGTSGALRILWACESVRIPPSLWCYRVDRRRFVMGGALSNGGDLYAWMMSTLDGGQGGQIESRIAAAEADGHGLTVLPFLSGERSTGWVASARGAITGMSLDTTPVDILRAGLEGVAYRFAAIYDSLVEEVGEPREIIGSGGALLRSPTWAQIITDVIGRPVTMTGESEPSCRGAALLALEALGAIADLEQAGAARGRVYLPDGPRHSVYIEARKRQQQFYEAVKGSGLWTA